MRIKYLFGFQIWARSRSLNEWRLVGGLAVLVFQADNYYDFPGMPAQVQSE